MSSIADILAGRGPLTGAQLAAAGGFTDILALWCACHAPGLVLRRTGRRYMRLDSAVEGYARLSPSIRREFLTYTLVGLEGQGEALETLAGALERTAANISRAKLDLARDSVCMALAALPDEPLLLRNAAFMIAGDITYQMAHRVPRPERSSGQMVRGSDLDIIIVTTDSLPESAAQALDAAIYSQKHYLLTHPEHQEEIDYILKPLARVREQLAFDRFEHMVACKILCECQLLYGSPFLFDEIMKLVDASGVREKLAALQSAAEAERDEAENTLLDPAATIARGGSPLDLFYTREESDEIY
ncbi:MAG TPA: hypothetical protein DCM68_06830 [Verrucomicrobia bacterium]|nr:hypothetical protein [Verrucomicrobiota bacterium]